MSEHGDGEDAVGDDERIPEWEIGLPGGDDLTPLSQSLVPSILAIAFSVIPERSRTIQDVNRASQNTLASLRSNGSSGAANAASSSNTAVAAEEVDRDGSSSSGSDRTKRQKKSNGGEAVDSMAEEGGSETEDPSGKTLKRPRLVWTAQLHKRFVEVVAHLGIKNAVPKTIMQLMNVQGLTRENVASHLQKYRLYLKRVQGLTTEGPSSSDQLFSSTHLPPQSFQDGGSGIAPANGGTGKLGIPIPGPSMQVYGRHMGTQGYHHNNHSHDRYHHQYHHHHQGNGVFESNPYKFGNMATSPSVGGGGVNDK